MRKLLIVDDEKNIRRGLQAMIEREYRDRYDIYLACDAFEALEMLRSMNIEILITDICMPEMDGIGLIKRIQDLLPKPIVVIVSGYDNFSYAKAAIRYEVNEYLLKPVLRDELAATLRRVEEELIRREERLEGLSLSAEQRAEYMESQLNLYSSHPSAEPEEIRNKLSRLDLGWLDQGFHAVLIKYAGDLQAPENTVFKARVVALLEQAEQGLPFRFVRFFDRSLHAVILTEGSGSCHVLIEQLKQLDAGLTFSVSSFKTGMEKLYSAYEEAAVSLKYTFLLPAPGVVWFEDIYLKDNNYQVPLNQITRLADLPGSGREKEMLLLLHEILDVAGISLNNIGYLEGISRALNETVFAQILQLKGKDSMEIVQQYKHVEDLYQFSSFGDYFREVRSLFVMLDDYIRTQKDMHADHKEMKTAVQYIHDNYDQNINMTLISNIVSYNYSYFSQAFREYTGENFVNYLKKYRIGKAKELLQTTDEKIYEIARKSGFENAKNFNRVFKESEGVSPLEFRVQKKILSAPFIEQ